LGSSLEGFLAALTGVRGGVGIIQIGLLLLIATPVVSVIFSVFAFVLQRDSIYVVVTLIVLTVSIYSILGGYFWKDFAVDLRSKTNYMFERAKSIGKNLKFEIKVYQLLLNDIRTPKLSKILLGLALVYAVFPFDIIPDFIPVLGHVDDMVIVPALIVLALKLVPKEVYQECKSRVMET
jgi:uncharacterized membrane protein YkvA (DUF1232 family)